MEQVMQQDLPERIRERAYEIWIASGHEVQSFFAIILGGDRQSALRGRRKGSRKAHQRPGKLNRSGGRPD